jgi:uncharacterized membrane protein (DUF485 family)
VFQKANNRRKENPSLHQKQMRFFTVLFSIILLVLFLAFLWLINRSGDLGH